MDNEHLREHEIEKEKAFAEHQEASRHIKSDGMEKYVKSLKDPKGAFELKEGRCVHCIDERTPGGLHSAGSGILRPKEQVIEEYRKAGVTKVTAHANCGAAKLYCKKNGIDEDQADKLAREWAEDIAKALGVPYEYLDYEQMTGPKGFHIARAAYYDRTGSFNTGEGFPPGFVISRGIQGKDDSLAELAISLSIAFGDHGYAELLTEESPFFVVVVGKTEHDLSEMKREIAELAHPYGNRVLVDGFVAPEL